MYGFKPAFPAAYVLLKTLCRTHSKRSERMGRKPDDLRSMSTDDIGELLCAWAALKWPDKTLSDFRLRWADGAKLEHPVRASLPGAAAHRPASYRKQRAHSAD